MSKRDNIESVVATMDGFQEVIVPVICTLEYLQLVFPNNAKQQCCK